MLLSTCACFCRIFHLVYMCMYFSRLLRLAFCVLCIYSRRKKNAPFPFPFRSVLLVMNGQKKWRAVFPVLPVPPSNPSACARSNESCLSGDPVYGRVCTRGRQYPPSLTPSLARPELNGRKRMERNGTAKKTGKTGRKTERNRMERTIKRNGTETERVFFTPTVHVYNCVHPCTAYTCTCPLGA